jgi:hypothetical protein
MSAESLTALMSWGWLHHAFNSLSRETNMSKIGDGYGSEFHLKSYIEKANSSLDAQVLSALGASSCVHWLFNDAHERSGKNPGEWVGMDFLPHDHPAREQWLTFWPQSGNAQNWDAVGLTRVNGKQTWLLVEAKAHLGELQSTCGAKSPDSVARINAALNDTKAAVGASATADWLKPYYQYANRLAALKFLSDQGVEARLVLVYFTGDRWPYNFNVVAPTDEAGWKPALEQQDNHLGLTGQSDLEKKVIKLFPPACCKPRE